MWPLLILFLVLGTASPYWMRAIDPLGPPLADTAPPHTPPATTPALGSRLIEEKSYQPYG